MVLNTILSAFLRQKLFEVYIYLGKNCEIMNCRHERILFILFILYFIVTCRVGILENTIHKEYSREYN